MLERALSRRLLALMLSSLVPSAAHAEVVDNVLLHWRAQAEKCMEPKQQGFMALMHVAIFDAVNSIAGKYTPYAARVAVKSGSSPYAAAAAAAHAVLAQVCPDQKSVFDAALKSSLELVKDSVSRESGAAAGRQAAAAVLAARPIRAGDTRDPFFASATPGAYVPTIRQVGSLWARQTPWVMRKPDELRPPPPPALTSAEWARDFHEIKSLGSRGSKARTAVQSDIARFWAPRDVRIVLRQLIGLPGRSLVDDARFLALAEMAWADSYVAMMDGKYAYNFWRPVTAIRSAKVMKNPAMVADSAWEGMISTPLHPEYPCGHCLSAAAVGTVIDAEFGKKMPTIVIDQDSVFLRRYARAQEYIDEVSESRIFAGVHYRFSANVGKAMGVSIGRLAVQRYFRPTKPSWRSRGVRTN